MGVAVTVVFGDSVWFVCVVRAAVNVIVMLRSIMAVAMIAVACVLCIFGALLFVKLLRIACLLCIMYYETLLWNLV